MQLLLPLALVLAVALPLAGCGSKKPETTAEWVNGACTAMTDWATSMKSSVSSLKSGSLSKDSIQSAGDDMKSATDTLRSDLKDLGKPNTQAGEQAKTSIDQLSSELSTSADAIKSAVDSASDVSSAVAAAATVSTTLKTMKNQVTSTYTSLKQLDSGELQTAFKQSSACTQLTKQLSSLKTQVSG